MMGLFPWTLRKLRITPPAPDPIPAKPAAEKLPPWRIEQHGGELHVTDGILCFQCGDSLAALRRLSDVTRIWPQGTGKPTAGEVVGAKRDGWRSGFKNGVAVGFAFGTAVAVVIQMTVLLVRG